MSTPVLGDHVVYRCSAEVNYLQSDAGKCVDPWCTNDCCSLQLSQSFRLIHSSCLHLAAGSRAACRPTERDISSTPYQLWVLVICKRFCSSSLCPIFPSPPLVPGQVENSLYSSFPYVDYTNINTNRGKLLQGRGMSS